ncbi:BON domain-containing protein [Tahibacter amnicola]|uniref:BON domain-containing protein n=1 Tax=Tahibacter amnicola TaxID=2976241 RepID=A0ABY6BKN6_9GAMM|nr:BON domain-containing protein [Tahibacter amnicola]UXI70337.1 BON domain-containing protein [Tahibacter amnicola]
MNPLLVCFPLAVMLAGVSFPLAVRTGDHGVPAQGAVTPGQCGAPADDRAIAAAITSRLRSSSRVEADEISVVVLGGIAQLSGLVWTDVQRRLAESHARDTYGVIGVSNQLDLVDWPPVTQLARTQSSERASLLRARQQRADLWITASVRTTLAQSRGAGNCAVDVRTDAGVVSLRGIMETVLARQVAIDLAAGTFGVQRVHADALLVR